MALFQKITTREVEKIVRSKSVETLQRNWENCTIKKCWNFTKKLRKLYNQKMLKLYKEIEKIFRSKVLKLSKYWSNFTTKNVWLNFMFDKLTNQIKVSSNVTIPIWTLFESYPKGIVQRISSHPKLTSLWAMRKKIVRLD